MSHDYQKQENGFTLIEVLIALAVFVITAMGVLYLQLTTMNQTITSEKMIEASRLASDQSERLLLIPFPNNDGIDNNANGTIDEATETDSNSAINAGGHNAYILRADCNNRIGERVTDENSEGITYTINWVVTELDTVNFTRKRIDITVTWQESGVSKSTNQILILSRSI
ncbi:MAG: prepilin-type N-terminal cleavage/methylation domain-containing protein [Desulfobacterales bacterium]|nr:prepilin-type N-terminal cleavage/methylation domain-containing protein [Desulfobacterales bacterium]